MFDIDLQVIDCVAKRVERACPLISSKISGRCSPDNLYARACATNGPIEWQGFRHFRDSATARRDISGRAR
jgi:hypothetical protein